MNLDDFKAAQRHPSTGLANAVRELQAGRKTSHWIWYIFPQVAGLGSSSIARKFALPNLEAAIEYISDPTLCANYRSALEAAVIQLEGGIPLRTLMGSDLDAMKWVSSVTLFREALRDSTATSNDAKDGAFTELIERAAALAASAGYRPCEFTLRTIRGASYL